MRLSLCMIVKNEAANLPRCLSSVQSVVDEMILLDTGSTDDTIAIAQSFGATVHSFPWGNDFASARNAALQYVTGDWVLVLDADEVLTVDCVPSLQSAMVRSNTLVINLIRQEVGAVQSPYSLVSRLFRRHPALRFSRPYHAMIDDSVVQLLTQEPHWHVVDLPQTAILHYGYARGAIASRQKLQTAKATMEGFLAQHPEDPYGCSKLGALYVQMGDLEAGVALLERGLRSLSIPPTPAEASVRYELHYHLGLAYSRLRQSAHAEQHYRSAIQQPILDCLKLGAYNNLGNLLQAKQDWPEARSIYETCLAIDPTFAKGHYNLGMTLKATGHLPEAMTQYQRAIALEPTYAEAYQNLGVVLLKLGRVSESIQAFQQAIVLHQQQNPQEAIRLQRGLQEIGLAV